MTSLTIDNKWDNCTKNYWNIAEVLHFSAKDMFRYTGKQIWEYNDNGQWYKDVLNKNLKKYISNDLYETLMKRILYWQSQNTEDSFEINYKILAMLEIATILKRQDLLKDIIREAREFFVVD